MVYLQGPKSAETVEKEQEAKLKAKYGNLGAKKKLMPKVCFVLAMMLEAAVLQGLLGVRCVLASCRTINSLTLLTGRFQSKASKPKTSRTPRALSQSWNLQPCDQGAHLIWEKTNHSISHSMLGLFMQCPGHDKSSSAAVHPGLFYIHKSLHSMVWLS